MDVLTNFNGVIICNIHMYQIAMLYIINLYNVNVNYIATNWKNYKYKSK